MQTMGGVGPCQQQACRKAASALPRKASARNLLVNSPPPPLTGEDIPRTVEATMMTMTQWVGSLCDPTRTMLNSFRYSGSITRHRERLLQLYPPVEGTIIHLLSGPLFKLVNDILGIFRILRSHHRTKADLAVRKHLECNCSWQRRLKQTPQAVERWCAFDSGHTVEVVRGVPGPSPSHPRCSGIVDADNPAEA
ncbi:hypothetical protein BV20DRAFT_316374 [Pilatotrama ljubarskyi]|nr:hypothetical protein BV20DRAFT_316374 [Pilatotrama ljubarskyi]